MDNRILAEIEPTLTAARHRVRTERWVRALPWIAALCALTLYTWSAVQVFNPGAWGAAPGVTLIAAYIFLGLGAAVWLYPVSHSEACRRIDAAANLPDSALTLWEAHALPPGFWHEQAVSHNLRRLQAADWRAGWPIKPSPYTLPAFAVLAATLALVALASRIGPPTPLQLALTDAERDQVSEMQQDFEEWLKEPPPGVEPEQWRELEEQVAGFEKRLSREDASRKDVLVELSKIEDKLAAMKESMDRNNRAANAEPLAEALDSLDQLQEAASALREGDYNKAGKALEKAAQQWKMENPENRDPAALKKTAQKMEDSANKMEQRGMQEAAQGARQTAQGMRNNNSQQASDGMQQMGQSLKKQGQQGQQGQQQLGEMGQQAGGMKEGFGKQPGKGKGKGKGKGEGDESQESEQAGAGSGKDLFGESSALQARIKRERLMGELGEGHSQIATKKAESGTGFTSPTGRSSGFETYEKLSHEAIQDESIPASHRESIRKYFESIRPQPSE